MFSAFPAASVPTSSTSSGSARERRRYERALRGASAQLRRSRARAPGRAWKIESIDIALALRRAERRRAAEEAARREREADRDAARAARVVRRAARKAARGDARDRVDTPVGSASAAGRWAWRASLAALMGSLAAVWLIG